LYFAAVSSKSKDRHVARSLGAKVYVCPAHVSADDERYYNVAKRLHEETKVLFTLINILIN
jgi:cystathionine beta-synthase